MKTKHGVQSVIVVVKQDIVEEVLVELRALPSGHSSCVVFMDVDECYPSNLIQVMVFDEDWKLFQQLGYTYYVRHDDC